MNAPRRDDQLRPVDDATELELASRPSDRALRPCVTMRVVRTDHDRYVRSPCPTDNPRYRRTRWATSPITDRYTRLRDERHGRKQP